jgi:outer membrane receptor protein involved in Fe transport
VSRALSAGAVVGLAAPLAYGQQTPAPVERMQRIEVTGSRIPLQTLESESPVTIMTQQDIANTGLTQIADVINQLPQAFADYGSMQANGASGTSTVNLRNLGAARTLVLVNGKRMPAGDPNLYPTDLNAIPAPLIQRIDVLTGGASSIYGSDAVAGVVNFIMNDRFEGVQLSWNGSGYNHQQHHSIGDIVAQFQQVNPSQFQVPGDKDLDGQIQDFSVMLGSNFANNRGNATVYFEYRKVDEVLQGSRDFSACSLGSDEDGFTCLGSGTAFPARFQQVFPNGTVGPNFMVADAAGNLRPRVAASDAFNFAPFNHFQLPSERYMFDAFAHYDVFTGQTGWMPNVRAYSEFMFMDDKTMTQIAPSGIFFGSTATFTSDNPLLSPAFRSQFGITPDTPATLIIGRRNVEGGGRIQDLRHTDYRIVLGAKGDFLNGKWNYDAFWQHGRVVYSQTYLNDFANSRILRALDAVTDPATGQPACRSALDGTDPACVPYNIFALGAVTPAALNYLQTPGFQKGETYQTVAGFNVNSDLGDAYGWKLPMARSGVGVSFGYERRVEKVDLQVDPFFSIPEGAGQGGPTLPLNGQYTVNDVFAEVRVPIVENQPWAQALNVNASYRYSDYSTDHTTDTYGIGAEWLPVKQARLRGTYQRAVRSANIIELFSAQGLNLFTFPNDPCGPIGTATLEQCVRSGLLPSQFKSEILDNPAGQGNFLQGGNPNLSPEKSDSYTVGVVLNPIPNLTASIDYWNIKVENTIGTIPSTLALNQCVFAGQFCDLVHRDALGTVWLSGATPATGGFITGTNINLGKLKTDGIDVNVDYLWTLPRWGSLRFNFNGTWLNKFEVEPVPGLGKYDCAGLFGPTCVTTTFANAPFPEWRHRFTTVWTTPWNVNVSATWRHFDKVELDAAQSNPLLAGDFSPVDRELSARDYLDLAAQWNINKNWTIRGGVNNVFDRDPPIVTSTFAGPPSGSGNTYPQVYDTLGRQLFVNVTAKF